MADRPLAAYDGDASYLFVSYSHEDDDLVYAEIRGLQDQGFNVAPIPSISRRASKCLY